MPNHAHQFSGTRPTQRLVIRFVFAAAIVACSTTLLDGQTPPPRQSPPDAKAADASTTLDGSSSALTVDAPTDWRSAKSQFNSGASGKRPTQNRTPIRPSHGQQNPSEMGSHEAWTRPQAAAAPPKNPDSSFFAGKTSPVARVGAAGDLIGFTNSDASGSQTITLVHTGKSWMAVYHIDRSGTIQLVSSRPIDADFALQLNATSPLPDDIREMGQR